jgi:uncharacterized OB-fold protein
MEGSELKPGVTISRCANCHAGYFPFRLICANCGSSALVDEQVFEAVVGESTVVRHAAGRGDWEPKHLATVRTDDGVAIVVGLLDGAVPDGSRVSLSQRAQAPYAKLSS